MATRKAWAAARLALLGATWMVAAGGCSVAPPAPDVELSARSGRAAREADMNAQWQHRNFRQLVEAKGPPRRLLDIPGGGNPPGLVAVYDRDPATGCLDTFALAWGTEILVRMYQCR